MPSKKIHLTLQPSMGTHIHNNHFIKQYNMAFMWSTLWFFLFPSLPFPEKNAGDLPGGPAVKNLPANAGDTGLIPDLKGSHMPQSN